MKKFPDFESYTTDEYDLFLPTYKFSTLTVEKNMTLGGIFFATIDIEVEGNADLGVYMEVVGSFIRAKEGWFQGNKISVAYQLIVDQDEVNTILEGQLIFTYLGGEKVVPIIVHVDREVALPTEVNVNNLKAPSVKPSHKELPPYLIQPIKRAFSTEEKATLRIINNQGYPMTVIVLAMDPHLSVERSKMTVEEVAYLTITYKKSKIRRIIDRYRKQPSVLGDIKISVRHDLGEDILTLPIHFTYLPNRRTSDVDNDRDYKRVLLEGQRYYQNYLLTERRTFLAQALVATEAAMAYHLTDVPLRLFYIVLLLEKGEKKQVAIQAEAILKYSRYYLEEAFAEFIEILHCLLDWIDGNDVSNISKRWPMTTYRQLFRLRFFEKNQTTIKVLEDVYHGGYKSGFVFAMASRIMATKSFVPNHKSEFYQRLLAWAVNKNAVEPAWATALATHSYRLIKYKFIGLSGAMRLHALYPNTDMLRLVLSLMIENGVTDISGHAMSLEALKRGMTFTGLELLYVRCLCRNECQPSWEYVHFRRIVNDLTVEEQAVLFTLYLKDPLTDKGYQTTAIRQSKILLKKLIEEPVEEGAMDFIAWWVEEAVGRQAWSEVSELLVTARLKAFAVHHGLLVEKIILSGNNGIGFHWLIEHIEIEEIVLKLDKDEAMAFIYWLLQSHEIELALKAVTVTESQLWPIDVWLDWLKEMTKTRPDQCRYILKKRYDRYGETTLLPFVMKIYRGSVKDMFALVATLPEGMPLETSFIERLLYKGLISRQNPVELAHLYVEIYEDMDHQASLRKAMNSFFVGQLLIEACYGLKCLLPVFEKEVLNPVVPAEVPMVLGLLKLYYFYGVKDPMITINLLNRAIKNGIIFPWFKQLGSSGQRGLDQAMFFSYHSKPYSSVTLFYRAQDQTKFHQLKMKHTIMGFYTGYLLSFYGDDIEYYYEEVSSDGVRHITSSGRRFNHRVVTTLEHLNLYDVVTTIEMGQLIEDDASVDGIIKAFVEERHWLETEMDCM